MKENNSNFKLMILVMSLFVTAISIYLISVPKTDVKKIDSLIYKVVNSSY